MRVIIIPEDGFVSKDGLGYSDLTFEIDSTTHAVQWYDTFGEVEYKQEANGTSIVKPQNHTIVDLTPYQSALDAWQGAKDAEAAAAAAVVPNGDPVKVTP